MSQVMTPPRPLEGIALALLTLALSMATFMQVLDTTIANVAIPTIAGNLGLPAHRGPGSLPHSGSPMPSRYR